MDIDHVAVRLSALIKLRKGNLMTRFAMRFSRSPLFLLVGSLFVMTILARPQPADAMGVATLPAVKVESGAEVTFENITVWYPSEARETTRTLGAFVVSGAWGSAPVRGNGALVILSH